MVLIDMAMEGLDILTTVGVGYYEDAWGCPRHV
jgi:hypothetical protein